MASLALQWAATLALSVVGGLVARWLAPYLGEAASCIWSVLRDVRAYLFGLVFGVSLATGAFLVDDIPWGRLVPVARRLAVAVLVAWFAKNLLYLVRINDRQLRRLERMQDSRTAPDGGSVEGRTDVTGTGMVGGAVAGGYLGAGFGPHGAVFGAVVGAALGDELEKESLGID